MLRWNCSRSRAYFAAADCARLRDADRLRRDLEAHVVQQPERAAVQAVAAPADQLALHAVEVHDGGGGPVDAELALELGDLDALAGLDEQQAQPVAARLVLGLGERQQEIRAAVRDEALGAVHGPCAVAVLDGARRDRAEFAAGVGLRQRHARRDLARAETREVALLKLRRREAVDRLAAALQREQRHQGRVAARDHLDGRRVRGDRQVQAAELAREREPHEARVAEQAEAVLHPLGIDDLAVLEPRPDAIDLGGARRDLVGRELAHKLQDHADLLDGVLERRGREFVRIGEVLLERGQDPGPRCVVDAALEVLGLREEVGHDSNSSAGVP